MKNEKYDEDRHTAEPLGGGRLAEFMTVEDVADWPKALNAVTAEDVMAAAQDVLILQNSVTGWLMKGEVE